MKMSVIKMVYRDLGMFWMSVLFKGLFSRVSLDFVLSEALQSFFYLFSNFFVLFYYYPDVQGIINIKISKGNPWRIQVVGCYIVFVRVRFEGVKKA